MLEDLGDTHERTDLDIPPTRRQAIAMVECLAKLHACWHDAPDLPEIATGFELARFAERISAIEAYLPEFMARMDDRLEQTDRAIIGDVIAQLPCRIHARMQERPLTLIHGDAHAWNFLVPNAGAAAAAMLVDWHYGSDEFRIGFGMWDVAYLMVHWWFPKRRRQLQPMLLAQYQQVMRDHGVTCRPGRLMEDLRLAASYCLLRPIVESRTGPPWSWYPQLEYALEAVRELAATA